MKRRFLFLFLFRKGGTRARRRICRAALCNGREEPEFIVDNKKTNQLPVTAIQ